MSIPQKKYSKGKVSLGAFLMEQHSDRARAEMPEKTGEEKAKEYLESKRTEWEAKTPFSLKG